MSYTIDGKFIKNKNTIEHFSTQPSNDLKYENLQFTSVIESTNSSKMNLSLNDDNKIVIKFTNVPLKDELDNIKNNSIENTLRLIAKFNDKEFKVDEITYFTFNFSETEDSFIFTSVENSSNSTVNKFNQNLSKCEILQISSYEKCSRVRKLFPRPTSNWQCPNESTMGVFNTSNDTYNISNTSNTKTSKKYLYPAIGGSDIDIQIIRVAIEMLENNNDINRENAVSLVKSLKKILYKDGLNIMESNALNNSDINDIISDDTINKDNLFNDISEYTNQNENFKIDSIKILKYLYFNLQLLEFEPTSLITYFENPTQRGPHGVQGIQGDVGDRGPIGNKGPMGIQGKRGPVGPQGSRLCVGGEETVCLDKDHVQFFIDLYNLSNDRV